MKRSCYEARRRAFRGALCFVPRRPGEGQASVFGIGPHPGGIADPARTARKNIHRGSQDYDGNQMGYTDAGLYVFDTANEGNSNAGHDYGTKLSAEQKRELMEYLKTL